MSNWVIERNEQVRLLKQHAKDIESKLTEALNALAELAEGKGIVVDKNEQWTTSMKRLASSRLVKIAKMNQADKPLIWWA